MRVIITPRDKSPDRLAACEAATVRAVLVVLLAAAVFTVHGCANYVTNAPPDTPADISNALSDRHITKATIAGRLTEFRTGEPVVAQIYLMAPADAVTLAETRTDLQGFFIFRALEPGNYRIVASEAGLGGDCVRRIHVGMNTRLFLNIRPTQVLRVRI